MSRNDSASLRRGVDLLRAVQDAALAGEPHGLTASEAAKLLGVHRSTVSRLATPLIDTGLLRREQGTGLFLLGEATLQLGRAYLAGLDLVTVALPHLRDLAAQCEAPAVLAVPCGTLIEYVAVEQDAQFARPIAGVGTRRPMHCTALGKAILAVAPPAWIDRAVTTGLHRVTEHTITDPSEFRSELARTLKRGFAIDDREFAEDIRALAAPVRGTGNGVLGAVAVADLPARMRPVMLREVAGYVMATARAISLAMGATPVIATLSPPLTTT